MCEKLLISFLLAAYFDISSVIAAYHSLTVSTIISYHHETGLRWSFYAVI